MGTETATTARPAATAIILRESPTGPEVLMLKRSGRAGFFPNAWVFPGGRVDAADRSARTTGTAHGLAPSDAHFAVAAIRETYEEAGVWMGEGQPTQDFRDALNQRTATLDDAPELVADLSRLAFWSWWITPENEPKRYDTRFFVTVLNQAETQHASPDQTETVAHRWVRPVDAVNEAEAGEFFMAPPTYLTLAEIADCRKCMDIMKLAAERTVHPIMPKLDIKDGQWTVILPGDPHYPAEHPVEGSTRAEFKDGRWHRS
jgi:8-oxo-dGTP pyrophosphatase MutT (NUDIX family)